MPTLNFKGKSFVYNHHLAVKYHQLVPKPELSLTDNVSLHDNLIIHGDNLKALKALLPTYAGKVKCIYIDPPYNTGNEGWVYNDNVNSPMIKEWLGKVVDKEDLTRHDKWLCMMMPRLKLLKDLLEEDGVIFVSIDDNEVHHLKTLMEEIFGENNFIADIIWEKRYGRSNDAKLMASQIDHILLFRKSEDTQILREPRDKNSDKIYSNPDNDPRGDWASVSFVSQRTREERPNLSYKIVNPYTKEVIEHPSNSWKYSEDKYQKFLKDNRFYWGKDGNQKYPRIKRFLSELREGMVPVNLWKLQDVGSGETGTREVEALLGKDVFDHPKPSTLIRRMIKMSTNANDNDIILDSFAGSGTTAHAVLEANREDGGNRKFILVEMEDYANTITAERIRRIIKKMPKKGELEIETGLKGTFSYFELGEPIEMESILKGKNLPNYNDLARYVFYTATGEQFNPKKVNEKKNFIGDTKDYEVYLFYKPDIEYLRNTALTLKLAESLGKQNGKKRLVFAPAKYVDTHTLLELRIEYCQLPFEIYRIKE